MPDIPAVVVDSEHGNGHDVQDFLMYQSFFDTFKATRDDANPQPDSNLVAAFEEQIRNALMAGHEGKDLTTDLQGFSSESLGAPSDLGLGTDDNSLFGSSEVMLGLSDEMSDTKSGLSPFSDRSLSPLNPPPLNISPSALEHKQPLFPETKRPLEPTPTPTESRKRVKTEPNTSQRGRKPKVQQVAQTPAQSAAPAQSIPPLWPSGFMPAIHTDGKDQPPKIPITRLKPSIAIPPVGTAPQPTKQQKKVAHNAIERRYRNNINDRIAELKNSVPALCHIKAKDGSRGPVDKVDGIPAATKLNKATILRKATEYIQYLRRSNEYLKEENAMIRALVQDIEGGPAMLATIQRSIATRQAAAEAEAIAAYDYDDEEDEDEAPQAASPQNSDSSNGPHTPPNGSGRAQRSLMALFMGVTFFGSPSGSKIAAPVTGHAWSASVAQTETTSLGSFWFVFQVVAFGICLAYILKPTLFFGSRPSKTARVTDALSFTDTTRADTLFQSLTRIVLPTPHVVTLIFGIVIQAIIYSLRRLLGINVARWYDRTSDDEQTRLLNTAIWARLGEVEILGGNPHASRVSVLHSLLKTVNHLEGSAYIPHNNIDGTRIYATAALQSLVVFGQHGGRQLADKFWYKARQAQRANTTRLASDSWLHLLFMASNDSSILDSEVAKDLVASATSDDGVVTDGNLAESTIPLAVLADTQALLVLKTWYAKFLDMLVSKPTPEDVTDLNTTVTTLLAATVRGTRSHFHAQLAANIWARHQKCDKIAVWISERLEEQHDAVSSAWWFTTEEAALWNQLGTEVSSTRGFNDPIVDDIISLATTSLKWIDLASAIHTADIDVIDGKIWALRRSAKGSNAMYNKLILLGRVAAGMQVDDDEYDSGYEDALKDDVAMRRRLVKVIS